MSDDAELQLAAALQGIPLEQAALMLKAKRAQGLANTPMPQGQQMGRVYKAASPLEALSAAVNRGIGYSQEKGLDQDFAALGRQAQAGGLAAMKRKQTVEDRGFGLQQGELTRKQAEDAATAQRYAADLDRKKLADKAEADYRTRDLALKERGQNQDQWSAVPDQTGGVVMFNKKTGQYRPLGPQGSLPGAGSGLKPQQFESDVQALGKDMEPIAKIQPDLATLDRFAGMPDQPGFGPVEGRVPNMLTSDEGVAARQASGRIMAGIIQMVSGQAASEKEVERLLEANGLGRTATPAQFAEGVKRLRSQYDDLVTQRTSKYHPTVVDTYKQRGGFTQPTKSKINSPDDLRKKYGL